MVIIPRSVNVSNAMYLQKRNVMQKCRHLGSTQFLSKSLGGISHVLSRMKYYGRVDTAYAPLRVSAAAAAFYARAVTLG